MTYRNRTYTAFYVTEPLDMSNLNLNAAKDFCYYNMIRAWTKKDPTFPFYDAHDRNYNVRDDSKWEETLKPRLHERLNYSKNILLILSRYTKNSKALAEEIEYGIKECELPIIVTYPDYSDLSEIIIDDKIIPEIKKLWNSIPVFSKNKDTVPVLHIPYKKELIKEALVNKHFMVNSKCSPGDFYYSDV